MDIITALRNLALAAGHKKIFSGLAASIKPQSLWTRLVFFFRDFYLNNVDFCFLAQTENSTTV